MAYPINKTDNSLLTTLEDGILDTTTTNLTLIGRNVTNYGDALNENFIKLLENFASETAPTAPLEGQLWWNSNDDSNTLNVRKGQVWKPLASLITQNTAPSQSSSNGDLWWKSDTNQLYGYTGGTGDSAWRLIGPSSESGATESGVIIETIRDQNGTDHVCMKLVLSSGDSAIVSKDPTFIPQTIRPGFPEINPGININSIIAGNKLHGTATNADELGNHNAAHYIRSNNENEQRILSNFEILNDTGLTIGEHNDLKLSVSGSNTIIRNLTRNGNLIIGVNDDGNNIDAFKIDGSSGQVSILNAPVGNSDITTKHYVDGLATNYLKTNENTSTSGQLSITNTTENALSINSRLNIGSDGDNAIIRNIRRNGDIVLRVNFGGTPTTALTIDGGTSKVLVGSNPTTALGVATKQYVDGKIPTDYISTNTDSTTSGSLGIANNNGLTVGASGDLTINVSGDDVAIRNTTTDGDLIIGVDDGGTDKNVITIDGATGEARLLADPLTSAGIVRRQYLDTRFTNPNFNGTGSDAGLTLPVGNTAARPTNAPAIIRWNSSNSELEVSKSSTAGDWEEVLTSKASQINVPTTGIKSGGIGLDNSSWYQWHGDILWQGGRVHSSAIPTGQPGSGGFGNNTFHTITFPTAFPNGVLSANVILYVTNSHRDATATIIYGTGHSPTTTTMVFRFGQHIGVEGYMWTAIGY